MGKNKQLAINMTAQILGFVVSSCISFFLTPYVVENVGAEAYGFVNLANNFVSYANLVSVALNSMAGTFITIKLHKNYEEEANKYFTSVVIANIFLAIITSILAVFIVINLDKLINISPYLLKDVQVLWIFIFLNFALNIIGGTYGIATFAKNRLDLSSIRNIQSSFLKGIALVFMYTFLSAKTWYIGFTACLCSLYVLIWNIHYTKKLIPNIKVKKNHFNLEAILEIVKSGIWNTITRLGQLLSAGLDLLITNLFIGPIPMGTLSIAKTVPTLIGNINGMLASVFSPALTIAYAKGNKEEILKNLKQSTKIMGIVVNIPIGLLIIYGEEFYSLWMPKEDGKVLQILSIITIICSVVECSIMAIYYLFTALNKVKENAISVLIQGILNTVIVLILLKTTKLGIYAVAGVSTILNIIRATIFAAPYGAKLLNLKWYTFFPDIIKSVLSVIILSILFYVTKIIMPVNSWFNLIISGAVAGILGFVLNIFLFLNKEDREVIKNIILKKILILQKRTT